MTEKRPLSLTEIRKFNLRTALRPETFLQWTSFGPLEKELKRYFESRFGHTPSIVANFQDYVLPERPVIDLVFYSDGWERCQNAELWPAGLRFRIWVLSRYSKGLLMKKTGITSRQIGIVPRYELFPIRKAPRPFPSPGEKLKLVYAGRIGERGKNFDLACALAAKLSHEWKGPVEFHICGPGIYPGDVAEELKKHDWGCKPRIHGDLGLDWTKRIRDGVLINLSTFFGEDFGVSVAQAQQCGWPVIVSDWAAFRELEGAQCLKLDLASIKKALRVDRAHVRGDLLFQAFKKAKRGRPHEVLKSPRLPDVVTREDFMR